MQCKFLPPPPPPSNYQECMVLEFHSTAAYGDCMPSSVHLENLVHVHYRGIACQC